MQDREIYQIRRETETSLERVLRYIGSDMVSCVWIFQELKKPTIFTT